MDHDVRAAARDAVAEVGGAQVGGDQVDALGETRLQQPGVDADHPLDAGVGAEPRRERGAERPGHARDRTRRPAIVD